MITTYGSYSHEDNETWHSISQRQMYSQVGRKTYVKIQWTIHGVKTATSVSSLTTKLLALEAAYNADEGDLLFYDNDGNLTAHSVYSGDTVSGTKVVGGVDYPGGTVAVGGSYGSGSEYTLRRTYKIVIEAEVLTPEVNVTQFQETIQTIGTGGPKNILMGSLTGPMQLQTVQLATPFYAIQTGTATGLTGWPDIPAPFAPTFLDGPPTIQKMTSPTYGRNVPRDYTIGWTYRFQSSALLIGAPSNF